MSSPLECELHDVRDSVLSTAVFPVSKTVPGIEWVLGKFLVKDKKEGSKEGKSKWKKKRKGKKGKGEKLYVDYLI